MSAHDEANNGGINIDLNIISSSGAKLGVGLGYTQLLGFKLTGKNKQSRENHQKEGGEQSLPKHEATKTDPEGDLKEHTYKNTRNRCPITKSSTGSLFPGVKHLYFEQKLGLLKFRTRVSPTSSKFTARYKFGASPDAADDENRDLVHFQEEDDEQEETAHTNRPKANEVIVWGESDLKPKATGFLDGAFGADFKEGSTSYRWKGPTWAWNYKHFIKNDIFDVVFCSWRVNCRPV